MFRRLCDLFTKQHLIDRSSGLPLALYITLGLILAGCLFPGSTKPVIKIGLVAPFEGEQRPQGYQRLYGVKLALQEINLAGGMAGYKIELVALNDYANVEEAISQAQELVVDSEVRAIVGQWDPALFEASAPIYAGAKLAVVGPGQLTDFSALPPAFAADFIALAGSLPDQQAQQAYLATEQVLAAIEQAVIQSGSPERAQVLQALITLD